MIDRISFRFIRRLSFGIFFSFSFFVAAFVYIELGMLTTNISDPMNKIKPFLSEVLIIKDLATDLDLQMHEQLMGNNVEYESVLGIIDQLVFRSQSLEREDFVTDFERRHLEQFIAEVKQLRKTLNSGVDTPVSRDNFRIIDESLVEITHILNEMLFLVSEKVTGISDHVLTRIDSFQRSMIFFVFGVVLLTLFVLFFFKRSLAYNFSRLLESTERLGQGNLNHRIKNTFKDEFGMLSNAFDSMAANLMKSNAKILEQAIEIEHMAYYDSLTGLPNRNAFFSRLEQEMERALRSEEKLGILFIDLDDFKKVNDVFGHEFGDVLLKKVAERLQKYTRLSDTIARLAGDEFTIIVPQQSSPNRLSSSHGDLLEVNRPFILSRRILDELSRPFIIKDKEIIVSSSIGIALFPDNGHTVKEIMNSADSAMYTAKAAGKNNYRFCSKEIAERMSYLIETERELHKAVKTGQFFLQFQPQIDISDRSVVGLEALIRWQHPRNGLVGPLEFIRIAENRGIIHDISKWVIKAVCTHITKWRQQGVALVPVMINLSAHDFFQQGIEKYICEIIKSDESLAGIIGIEITESCLMEDRKATIKTLSRFREMGLTVALDDFGTGYSSMNYLKHLPVDTLKIDRSFLSDVVVDDKNAAITKAIICMSHAMGLKVLAEGIETPGQLDFIRNANCDFAQGFLFSEPLSEEIIPEFLLERSSL